MAKKRVLVAMSGGVDSSVTAFLLKQKGFEVIGVTMCFGLEDRPGNRPSCCSISGIEDARRVAAQLDIPYYTISFGKLLKQKVVDEFIKEYLCGRTPNPCVHCNQFLKFDALIKNAKELNCQYLATGHYVRLTRNKNGKYLLKKAKDTAKDQSYFLYRIPKEQMDFLLFPLGNYTKQQVRNIAKDNYLRVADKPASQEICFIPNADYKEFFRQRLKDQELRPGPIKDINGNILGQHKGIVFYTIGQRQGLGIAYKCPLYVVNINLRNNTIIVGEKKDVFRDKLLAKELHLLALDSLSKTLEVKAKIRYNHPDAKAIISPQKDGKVMVEFKKPQWAITPGQSIVFYKNSAVIGGAVIEESL